MGILPLSLWGKNMDRRIKTCTVQTLIRQCLNWHKEESDLGYLDSYSQTSHKQPIKKEDKKKVFKTGNHLMQVKNIAE